MKLTSEVREMRLFVKIRAGEQKEYQALRSDKIHKLVQRQMGQLVERFALFDEIIVEEP